jgi:hypothetical protein
MLSLELNEPLSKRKPLVLSKGSEVLITASALLRPTGTTASSPY